MGTINKESDKDSSFDSEKLTIETIETAGIGRVQ